MDEEITVRVLEELLDEYKKQNIAMGEMNYSLKEMSEKIILEHQFENKEAPSINERLRAVQISCKSILEKLYASENKPADIKKILTEHGASQTPPVATVKHHHHVNISLILSFTFLLLFMIMTCLYFNKIDGERERSASDVKYRFMKLIATPNLLSLMLRVDSSYSSNPEGMKSAVIKDERQRLIPTTLSLPQKVEKQLQRNTRK